MSLTKYELETIICYNQEEKHATIDTCDRALINRLNAMCKKSSDITVKKEDKYGRKYHCPKGWIKVQMPRQYTTEERQNMADRARAAFKK